MTRFPFVLGMGLGLFFSWITAGCLANGVYGVGVINLVIATFYFSLGLWMRQMEEGDE